MEENIVTHPDWIIGGGVPVVTKVREGSVNNLRIREGVRFLFFDWEGCGIFQEWIESFIPIL